MVLVAQGCNLICFTLLGEQAQGYVADDWSSGFVTYVRSPRAPITNWGKAINERDANPSKEGKALARRNELEGCRFKSWWWKRIFSREISIKVNLWHHLDVEFVHYTYLCVDAQCINSLGRCARNWIKNFFLTESKRARPRVELNLKFPPLKKIVALAFPGCSNFFFSCNLKEPASAEDDFSFDCDLIRCLTW